MLNLLRSYPQLGAAQSDFTCVEVSPMYSVLCDIADRDL